LSSESKKSRVEAQDFTLFKHPRALALSPDGGLLAFTLAWCDPEKKKYFANLYVLEVSAKRVQQWTRGAHTDRNPVWSPDGSRLAFLRHDQGLDRVFLISREGGEPEEICKEWGGFAQIKWAGNEALIVKFRPSDADPEAEKAIAEGKEPPAKAPAVRKIKRLYYRLDGEGYLPQKNWQLFKLSLNTRKLSQLTRSKADIGSYDVSAAGDFCVYVANVHRDPDLHPYHQQILLLNLHTGRSHELPIPLGEKDAVALNPDGRRLVYLGHHNLNDAWGVEPVHPYLVDLQTGKHRDLTPHFDRQANDQMLGDIGYGGGLPFLAWSADGRKIYHQVTDEGDVYLARTGLGTGRPERVWNSKGHVALATVSGKGLALLHLSALNLGTLYHCADNTSLSPAFETVATFNSAYLKSRRLGNVREVRFKSGDGTHLHGWLVTPPDFRPTRKYPAILEVHGGPRMQYGRTFFHEMQYLAAQGFVIFMTNPRGSQGYGKEFAGSTVAAWGTDDFNDIMAAADWLEAQAFVDQKRIGITGGSYGGYMTALVVSRTHRFRAAVEQRGVVNLVTMQSTSDVGYDVRYEFGGYHWENPVGYEKMSPITYARNIRTPLLILHNEGDLRCPIEQAEQLFSTVKILDKAPVEFWRFPEEFHGLSRGGRPDRRILRLEGIAAWFRKWMPPKG
jgi:dipeptidyl aminopeptidase/acylaminoacyl peptidase